MSEPVIAIVSTTGQWGNRLHNHLTDHGGARVCARIFDPHDAVMEHYDVLVVDDTTSYLSTRFVTELRRRGRLILGVHDSSSAESRHHLETVGVDAIASRDATPEELLAEILRLAPTSSIPDPADEQPEAEPPPARGRVVLIAGPPGGCGVTEVAIAVATVLAQQDGPCALVDASGIAPSISQRLALPPYPNLLAAIETVDRRGQPVAEAVVPMLADTLRVLPGISPETWRDVRPSETLAVLDALTADNRWVVVDGGPAPWPGVEDARQAAGRPFVELADTVIGVGLPGPVGLVRLVSWFEAIGTANPTADIHVILNRTTASHFQRAEAKGELGRVINPVTVSFATVDSRVEAAEWTGGVVGNGPFLRSVRKLTDLTLLSAPTRPALAP